MTEDLPASATRAASEAGRLRVFVSYARRDASDFAEYLVVALELAGFDAYLDRHDIATAEDWEIRIGELIDKCDTMIFVISPASIESERCEWEVKRTVSRGKRLIPVQWIAVPETKVPPELKRLQYTIFASGQPFSAPLAELATALRQDLGWLRRQTELREEADRWDAGGRDPDLLLRGKALAEARNWVLRRKPDAPAIWPMVNVFIGMSEQNEAAEQDAAREQLKEREQLLRNVASAQALQAEALSRAEQATAERQEALAIAEKATAEKLQTSRRLFRSTVAGVVVALVLIVLAGGLGYLAMQQNDLAKEALREATTQRARAQELKDFAEEETARADEFVRLVSSNPAGQRAMERICLEAIDVTARLANAPAPLQQHQLLERFKELFYGPMYIIELHQKKSTGMPSRIEISMIAFRNALDALGGPAPAPPASLCERAEKVRTECVNYLKVTAAEACPKPPG